MTTPIGGLSGFAGIERIIKKFYEIQNSIVQIQDKLSATSMNETPSFHDALSHARERQSTDGKTKDAAAASPSRSTAKGGPDRDSPSNVTARRPKRQAEQTTAPAVNAAAERTSMEKRLMDTLKRELPKYNVPPDLALAVMQAESNFNPSAVSPKGAIGVMQMMPSTAASFGVEDAEDLYEPEVNIPTGLQYLSNLLSRYGGDEKKALAAYNAGPAAVERHGGVPPFPETQTYIKKVFEIRQRLNEGADAS